MKIVNYIIDKIGNFLFSRLSNDNIKWFQLCRQYVDRYNNENNDDIDSNGELQFLKQKLTYCGIVFDIGANKGEWAQTALSINSNLSLYCFEPSVATYNLLISRQFPENVICNNFGFGSKTEEKALYIFEDGSGLNSLYPRRGLEMGWGLQTQNRIETVFIDTIDNYCQSHNIEKIDFLKVDVEGHELEVFKGAKQLLSGMKIKFIQFEYGGCNIDSRILLKDIFEFFQPYNYTFYKIYPNKLRKFTKYDQRLENFQYQNWALIQNEILKLS